jgi:hypothetical protein
MTHRDRLVRGMLVAAAAGLCWAAAPATAHAQECSKAAQKAAEAKYDTADKAYNLGKWDDAIKAFEDAFESCPNQWYLYGMAQAYRKADNCTKALFFYKRYLAFAEREEKDRRTDIEEKVSSVFIPELEGKCKDTRNTPPEDIPKGGGNHPPKGNGTGNTPPKGNGTGNHPPKGNGTGNTPPKGNGTGNTPPKGNGTGNTPPKGNGTGNHPPKGNGTGNTPPKGNGQVATTDDDDDDDDDDDYVVATAPSAKLISSDAELGAAVITGLGSGVNVPAQFDLRLGAGYPLHFGKIELVAGGLIGYTPIPWDANGMSGSTSLFSLLANGSVGYPVIPKLNVRGELGMGVQWWTGLKAGNPFTMDFAETTGALGMFNLRFALGAEYLVTRNIVVTATLPGISYSPAPSNMRDGLSSVTRIEFLVGAGYKM